MSLGMCIKTRLVQPVKETWRELFVNPEAHEKTEGAGRCKPLWGRANIGFPTACELLLWKVPPLVPINSVHFR
jgi:hypothetical protein